jgi:hypothetical protein
MKETMDIQPMTPIGEFIRLEPLARASRAARGD